MIFTFSGPFYAGRVDFDDFQRFWTISKGLKRHRPGLGDFEVRFQGFSKGTGF